MEDKRNRFWDTFWVVGPLIVGALIGFYFAGQFPSSTLDCNTLPAASSASANFALAVALVALLVGRVVARSAIGPVAARAFTMAALGLVVTACGSFFITTRSEPCPPSGVASGHEAMVRVPYAQLHLP